MRRHSKVGILTLVLFCCSAMLSGISCGQSANGGRGPSNTDAASGGNGSSQAGGNLADLPGTYWSLMSLTKKGEKEQLSQNPPDVQFCKDGTWSILHYGGRHEGGRYQVQGSRLVMRTTDGALYGDFQLSSRTGQDMLLDSGNYVMRLRYLRKVSC
jgi:hypothetical protein